MGYRIFLRPKQNSSLLKSGKNGVDADLLLSGFKDRLDLQYSEPNNFDEVKI